MAVESRYVVIRKGVEVETFMDKKAADEYDKMLDMADNLAEMFQQAPVELSEALQEELSIYLAQNRDNVLIALQAKKPQPAKKVKVENKTESKAENKAESKVSKVTDVSKKNKESDAA